MSFAKVWLQILDSSVADDWKVRHVFEDFLKLGWPNGVVDMTAGAIHRRTNTPIDVVLLGIAALEAPDPRSRTPDNEGRRIMRLDSHRDWGWRICNWERFKQSADAEALRVGDAERKRRYRARFTLSPTPPISKKTETERERENSPQVSRTRPGQKRTVEDKLAGVKIFPSDFQKQIGALKKRQAAIKNRGHVCAHGWTAASDADLNEWNQLVIQRKELERLLEECLASFTGVAPPEPVSRN